MGTRFEFNDLPPQKALTPFVEEFLADRNQEISELHKALAQSDFELIRATSHKWKGFSAPYGFHTLAKYAEVLEQAALNNNAKECEALLSEIKNYLEIKKQRSDELK